MLSADLSRKFQEVLAAYLEAKDRGQSVDPDKLRRQHPELADELNEFFANERKFASAAGYLAEKPTARRPPSPPAPLPKSTRGETPRIGDYEILGEIARGGMGVVYRARHVSLQRQVALKMMLAGALVGKEGVRRFRSEAEAVAELDHPNIVPIYDSGEHQGQAYFCMKLIDGPSLKQQMASYLGKPEEAARLIVQIARAVHHAHQRGILHRDLKPGNILLQIDVNKKPAGKKKKAYPVSRIPQSAPFQVQFAVPFVTDFGLAKRVQDDGKASQSTTVVGTASYMALEQATGGHALTVGADVYGLGAVLFELLTGRPPFVGANQMEVLLQLVDKEPPSPTELQPRLDPDLARICLKCLRKNPAERYESAEALAVELEQWLQGEPLSVRAPTRSERMWRLVRRRPGLVFFSAVVLIIGSMSMVANWHLKNINNQLTDAIGRSEAATGEAADHARKASAAAEREREAAEGLRLAQRERDATEAKAEAARGAEFLALRKSRQLLVEHFVASGQQHLLRDDLYGAAVWFGEALAQDQGDLPRETMHRVRIAATLRQSPALLWFRKFDDKVGQLRLSPAGDRLAIVGNSGAVSLFDTKTGQRIGDAPSLEAKALDFSPDGQWLMTLGGDGAVRLWSAATGLPHGNPLTHGQPIRAAVFSPDSKWIATAGADRMRIWETATTKPTLKVEKDVRSLSFRPDGKKLLGVSEDLKKKGELHLWDLTTGKDESLPMPKSSTPSIRSAGFSRDGKRIYALTAGKSILLWGFTAKRDDPPGLVKPDVVTGDRAPVLSPQLDLYFQPAETDIRVFELPANKLAYVLKHDSQVQFARFSPRGRLIATGSANRGVQLWRADTGQPFCPPLPHGQPVSALAFSADDQWLATVAGDRVVRLWRLSGSDKEKTVTLPKTKATLLSVSPDGAQALIALGKSIDLWDIDKRRSIATLATFELAQHVRWGPDGKSVGIAGATEARVFELAAGKTLTPSWRLDKPLPATQLPSEAAEEWSLWANSLYQKSKSPPGTHVLDCDGRRRAVWKNKGALEIEDLGSEKGKPIKLAVLPEAFAFSPERRFGAAGFKDGSLRIWDLEDRKPSTSLFWHGEPIRQLVYSADGRLLASASASGRIRVWDAVGGQPLSPAFFLFGPPAGLVFRPDGAALHAWTAEGRVHYWSLAPTPDAPAELLRRIRLAAGQKFDASSGSLIPLDADELNGLWLAAPALPLP
jgi:eukaryotic-like serine/threonine-protein kinase